jgi:predicted alpha/beta superfamily hydrolase
MPPPFYWSRRISLELLQPTSWQAALERPEGEPLPASTVDEGNAGADPELDGNPRYSVYAFHSEILPDDRHVMVYVPPQYLEEPARRFPVLYLHDGQNLFDGRTSYLVDRTWQAHTTADRLVIGGEIEPVILVGIANTGLRRMAEYTPTRDPRLGGGEGSLYGRMLIEELKPAIDSLYRTLPEAKHTGLGGSSLGGLISLFLGLTHPEVFGRLAVMSPSVWWDHRSIFHVVNQPRTRPGPRIWLDIGTAEGGRHVRDTDLLQQALVRQGWRPGIDLAYTKVEGGTHDETAWAERFDDVLRFLFPKR